MELNLGLDNNAVYNGVVVSEVGGRKSIDLTQETLNQIGKNIANLVNGYDGDRDVVVLTGGAPIPVYLVAAHLVLHVFHSVQYKNQMVSLEIARH